MLNSFYFSNFDNSKDIYLEKQPINAANWLDETEIGWYDDDGTPYHIFVDNDYVFLGGTDFGVEIFDASDPSNPIYLSRYENSHNVHDMWVENDLLYFLESYKGLRIIDVSDPMDPTFLGSYEDTLDNDDLAIYGDFAYILTDNYGFRIIDISDPMNPIDVGGITNYNFTDITIKNELAYIADKFHGLMVYNLSIASAPELITTVDFPSDDACSITVNDDLALVSCYNDGVTFLNISDVDAIEILGDFYEENYHVTNADVSGNVIFMNNGYDGMGFLNISDPEHPQKISQYNITVNDFSLNLPHVYVAGNGNGFSVYDMANVTNVTSVGSCLFRGGKTKDIDVEGDLVYVADGQAGLEIINITDPSHPKKIGSYYEGGTDYTMITVDNDIAFIQDTYLFDSGVHVIDVSDPLHPVKLTELANTYQKIIAEGDFLYLADYGTGLRILNVSDPANPVEIAVFDTQPFGNATDIDVEGDFAYLADGKLGLHIIDISNKTNPVEKGSYSTPEHYIDKVSVDGDYAYVMEGHYLRTIDITNKSNPIAKGADEDTGITEIMALGNYVYTAQRWYFVVIYDVSNPDVMVEVRDLDAEYDAALSWTYNLDLAMHYVFVADGLNGLKIVDPGLDQDEDGLSDASEVHIYNTELNNSDTDGDGFLDGEEIDYGSDPLDETDFPPSQSTSSTTDSIPTSSITPNNGIPGYPLGFLLTLLGCLTGIVSIHIKKHLN